jgi:hypothetical protein
MPRARNQATARRRNAAQVDPSWSPKHFDIGDTAVIVHGDMDVLPADARTGAPAIAVDPVADTADAAQRLDIDVNHVARPRPFVAVNRDRRNRRAIEPQSPQPGRDGRAGDLQRVANRPRGQACCSRSH